MADQEASHGQPSLIYLEVAYLAVHLPQGSLDYLGVVPGTGELPGCLWVIVLDIGHVNVDDAV